MAFGNGDFIGKIRLTARNEGYLVLDKLIPVRVFRVITFKSKSYIYTLNRIGSKHRTEVLLCSMPGHQIHAKRSRVSRRRNGRSYIRFYLW
ncbi:hypothetical protein D3C71_1536080 [compost metagenome]